MELTLRQDAINETYADTERLIYHTVHAFIRRYGGSVEDLVENASLSFMRALLTYDNTRGGKFSARLRSILWYDFLELYRQRAKHRGKVIFTDIRPEAQIAPKVFDHVMFLDQLSDDARLVVETVFNTSWQYEPEPATIRTILREYLRGLYWSSQRISDTFKDIRKALQEGTYHA